MSRDVIGINLDSAGAFTRSKGVDLKGCICRLANRLISGAVPMRANTTLIALECAVIKGTTYVHLGPYAG